MKTRKRAAAKHSGARKQKQIQTAPSTGAANRSQTHTQPQPTRVKFKRDGETVLDSIAEIISMTDDDNLKGAIFMLRSEVAGLIEAGKSLSGGRSASPETTLENLKAQRLAIQEQFDALEPIDSLDTGLGAGEASLEGLKIFVAEHLQVCAKMPYGDAVASLDSLATLLKPHAPFAAEREAMRKVARSYNVVLDQGDEWRRVDGQSPSRQPAPAQLWLARFLESAYKTDEPKRLAALGQVAANVDGLGDILNEYPGMEGIACALFELEEGWAKLSVFMNADHAS